MNCLKLKVMAGQAAINNEPAPRIPRSFDVRLEIEKRLNASFTSEFTKQMSIITLRKILLQTVKRSCTDKFADKIIRDVYSKLRRTVSR